MPTHYKSRILIKTLLATCALVAASVVSLSGLFLLRHQTAFQRQFELRAESLANSLAAQSQFALLLGDRDGLARLVRSSMAGSGDVLYVVVEDASGKYMAGTGRPPLNRQSLPSGAADIKLATIRNLTVSPGGAQCVEASVPVILQTEGGPFGLQPSQADVLGRIRVALSLESQQVLFGSTLRYVTAIMLLILLVACVIDYVQIRRLLRPLVELAEVAKRIGRGDGESFRAGKQSDDEIGVLVDSFNEMVDQVTVRTRELHDQVKAKELANAELAEAQQRLIELSRQAGMAEVATGVLHNVGNVLNSVNVSATIAAGKIGELRLDNLNAAVGLLSEHPTDLGEFLSRDSKGVRVIPYLAKLGKQLERDRDISLLELEQLRDHVGHIKEIVATQQNFAKVCGLVEKTSLAGVMEDVLRIVAPTLERHKIRLERDFEALPEIEVDRHQILQILLNLLRNAKESVKERGDGPRLIRLGIHRQGDDRVRIEVRDSGIGLDPQQLTRIFAHGFTTKRNGHGFGLHSGALAAKQLGGSLWAESDGPGLGASFILELPWVEVLERKAG